MLRASIKNVWAHKLRMALTGVAIVLGVGLISGTYVYTDTIAKAFDNIFEDAFSGIDIVVTAESELQFGESYLDESVIGGLSDVEGIESVAPFIQGRGVAVLDGLGEPIGVNGPPKFAANFDEATTNEGGGFQLAEGTYPFGPDQIVVDAGVADSGEFEVGDRISIVTPTAATQSFELVGIASFGELDSLGGATFALFDLPTTQLLLDRAGQLTGASIQVVPGVDVDAVIQSIEPVLPENGIAQSGQSAAEAQAGDIQEGFAFFTIFLLVFGYIAVFVGAFLIYNTFQIVVRQRTKELALFRALGATRRQVNRMVLLEALLVSIISSVAGIIFGLGMAKLLDIGLSAAGLTTPSAGLSLQPRTVVVGMAVGIIVTLLSAMIPAYKASRVPPMAALREEMAPMRRSLKKRVTAGAIVTGLGLAVLALGLFGETENGPPAIALVGLGAAIIFFGIFILSPLFARPIAGIIGAPFQRFAGVEGKLARENSMRSPRRTSATAIAVLISVTLVALVSVFSASIRGTINDILGNDIKADLIVTSTSQFDPTASFTPELANRIESDPAVSDVTRVSVGSALIGDAEKFITGGEDDFADYFPPDTSEGTLTPGLGQVVIDRTNADANDLEIGDELEMEFSLSGSRALDIVGIADGDLWTDVVLISRDEWIAQYGTETDNQVYIRGAGGTEEEVKAAIEEYATDVPTANLQTFSELLSDAEDQLDGLLNIFLGLLTVTVLIGMLGVTNTMTLSVVERKREIGLLRAVGLARKPTKRMVRYEAAIVSIFGAVLGVALGIFFGWAILRALADQGFSAFVIPWFPTEVNLSAFLGSLGFWVVITGVLGIVFAVLPARKAAKLNILDAIKFE